MKARHFMFILAGSLLLCAVASCTKDHVGRSIRFRGMTSPGHFWTRTSYSGETTSEGGVEYERIDWKAGDKVLVNVKHDGRVENEEYEIGQVDVPASGQRTSTASFEIDENATEEEGGLQWHGNDVHDIWAAYPSSARIGDLTATSTVPARQTLTYRDKRDNIQYFDPDMSLLLMTAGLRTTPQEELELWFYPAVTTFDFTVGAMGNTVITGFEMETIHFDGTLSSGETTNLTGDAVVTYPGNMPSTSEGIVPAYSSTPTSGQTDRRTITAVFDKKVQIGVSDSETSPKSQMNFKVFAIPEDITGVRINFYIDDGTPTGATRWLDLKFSEADEHHPGAWMTFEKCMKYNIKGLLIPGAEWKITVAGPMVEEWVIHPDIQIGVGLGN